MRAQSWLDDPTPPVAQARAALLAEDPPTWQQAHLPEYRRRLLAVYAACAGWPRARVAPLWPFVEAAERAFALGAAAAWGLALDELERRVGITGGAGTSPGSGGADA